MLSSPPTRRDPGPSLSALKDANSALLREDVAARRTVYRGLPEVVTLNHSDVCNLRCVMCPRHVAQGRNRLDRATLDHVAHELLPTARKLVLTTAGAEPLAVDYELLMEHALRFEVRVDAVTNGTLLTRDVYRASRAAFDHLNVSLDSHRPEVYERIRAGSRFERVFGNLQAVCEERASHPDDVLFSVSAIVLRSNVPHLAEFVAAMGALGTVDAVVFQRLRHEEQPLPEEEPFGLFSEAEIDASFQAAREAAERHGINLFLSEFGQAPALPRPLRAKIPETLEGRGLCWFLAQNFTVMYTGEVFPCCIPTDFSLGNVLYEDPADIWNGAAMQRLRKEHLSKRGNLFCSGCLHAPHLGPPPGDAPTDGDLEARRAARVTASERAIEERKRTLPSQQPRIFAPPIPPLRLEQGGFQEQPAKYEELPQALGLVTDLDPGDGSIWSLEERRLVRRPDVWSAAETVWEIDSGAAPSCLTFVAAGTALFGFEDGLLRRFDAGGPRCVLKLSDPRAFVRDPGIDVADDGTLWIGEYGVFPGARCAHVYRSQDGGRRFHHVEHLRQARHVHVVACLTPDDLAVTTGDIADERRMYLATAAGRFEPVRRGWSGYTALSASDTAAHAGTDLPSENGILCFRDGLRGVPEFRALPPGFDVQVRQIEHLGGGRLVALCVPDATPGLRAGKRGVVLLSGDDGRSYQVVHRFRRDWSDAPDRFLVLDAERGRLLLPGPERSAVLTLPDRTEHRHRSG